MLPKLDVAQPLVESDSTACTLEKRDMKKRTARLCTARRRRILPDEKAAVRRRTAGFMLHPHKIGTGVLRPRSDDWVAQGVVLLPRRVCCDRPWNVHCSSDVFFS